MRPGIEDLEDRTLQTALPDEAPLPRHYTAQTTTPFTTPDTRSVDPSHPNAFLDKMDSSVIGQLAAEITAHTASLLSTPADPAVLQPLLAKVEQGKSQLDAAVSIINTVHPLLDDAQSLLAGWQAKGAPAFDGQPGKQPFSPDELASIRTALDVSKAKLDNLTRTSSELKLALDKADAALQTATNNELIRRNDLENASRHLEEVTVTFDTAKKALDTALTAVADLQKALDTDTALLNAINKECNDAYAIFWKAAQEYIPVALDSEAHPDDLELKAKADALLKICMPLWIAYDKLASKAFYTRYPIRVRINAETAGLADAAVTAQAAKDAFDAAGKSYDEALAAAKAARILLDAAINQRMAAQADRNDKLTAYTNALAAETAVLKEGIATATILFQRLAATDQAFHTVFDTALTTLVADERGLTDTLHAKQHEGVKQLSMQAEAVTGLPSAKIVSASEIADAVKNISNSYTLLTAHLAHGRNLLATISTALTQAEFTDDAKSLGTLKVNLTAYVAAVSDAITILIDANTHSHIETYTDIIPMNFSAFGEGIHPNGIIAAVPDIGRVTLYGDEFYGEKVMNSALTFVNGKNLAFGFAFTDGERFVQSLDINDRGTFAYNASIIVRSATGEKSYPITAPGTLHIGQMASSIAINPGNGTFMINNVRIPVEKQRMVTDPINPVSIGDVPNAFLFIDQQIKDYIVFIASAEMQPLPNEIDLHSTIALERQAARMEKFAAISANLKTTADFLQLILTDPIFMNTPELKVYLAQAQALSDEIAPMNDAWQHDNRALLYRQMNGKISEAGALLDMRSTTVPAMVGPASQGENPSLSTGVPELGGSIIVTAVRGDTAGIPVFNSVGQTITTGGRLTTIDLTSVASVVTAISFVVTADQPTTVHFVRGETILATRIISVGDTASYEDDAGIEGVILEHTLIPLSELAQDAVHEINFGEIRLQRLWDLRYYGGRYTNTIEELVSRYISLKKLNLTPAQRQALTEEVVQGGPKAAAVMVSDIELAGAKDYLHINTPYALTIDGNGIIASKTSRLDSAHPIQLGEFAGDVYIQHGGDAAVRNPVNWYKPNPNPNGYARFDIFGSASIGSLGYVGSNGLQPLPTEWYDIIDGKTAIVKPNAPLHLVVCIASCNGTYQVINGRSGSLDQSSVTPPEQMTLTSDFDGPYVQAAEKEGFIDGIFDSSRKRREHVLFGASEAAYTLHNIGIAGGAMTVRVYSGYASSKVRGEQIGSYTTTIGGLSQKTLIVNVRPASGVPAQKEEAVIITFVTTLPNGTEKIDTIALNTKADTTMSSSLSADGTVSAKPDPITAEEKLRMDRIVARIEVARNGGKPIARTNNDPSTTLASQYQALYPVISDAITDILVMQDSAQAENLEPLKAGTSVVTTALKLTGLQIEDSMSHLFALLDKAEMTALHGAAEAVQEKTLEAAYKHLISLYTLPNSSNFVKIDGKYVRTDTVIGKIVAGIFQRVPNMSDASVLALCNEIQQVAGISSNDLYGVLSHIKNGRFERRLLQLFETNGYASIISDKPPSAYNSPLVSSVTADKISYTGGTARIHFDVSTTKEVDHARVSYGLLTPNNTFFQTGTIDTDIRHQTFIDIPVSDLPFESERYSFKIATWFVDQGIPAQGNYIKQAIEIKNGLKDLSTIPLDTEENREKYYEENMILNQMLKNFPLNLAEGIGISAWHRTIASDAHLAGNNRTAAIDMNFGSGTADRGKLVKSVAAGTVVFNKLDSSGNSTLIIEHKLKDGKAKYYSVYLHMQTNDDGTVGTYKVGDKVEEAAEIGKMGNVGSGENNDHFHFELRNTQYGETIEARKVLEELNVLTRAEGPSRNLNVVWDTELAMWKPIENENPESNGIAFYVDGNTAMGSDHNVWVALENGDKSKMVEVRWKTLEYMNDQGIIDTKAIWVNINDDKRRWNPAKRKFVDRLTNI